MIRNIPNKYTINELAAEIDSEHANTYDFLYLPCDLKVTLLLIFRTSVTSVTVLSTS